MGENVQKESKYREEPSEFSKQIGKTYNYL